MSKPLEAEFRYYVDNQASLSKTYAGKVIVIVGQQVIGAYDTELDALTDASKKYKLGTFLIQKCGPGSETYRQTFRSRVAFA